MKEYTKTDIRHILDLYYEGKSSVADEEILRGYFAGNDVDEEFADDKLFFVALDDAKASVDVPADFKRRLEDAVESWQESERNAGRRGKRSGLFKWVPTIGIAASLALLFTVGSLVLTDRTQEPVDTFTDPMDAYAETHRVLTMFATTMEKGRAGIEVAEQRREKAFAIAIEQLNKI